MKFLLSNLFLSITLHHFCIQYYGRLYHWIFYIVCMFVRSVTDVALLLQTNRRSIDACGLYRFYSFIAKYTIVIDRRLFVYFYFHINYIIALGRHWVNNLSILQCGLTVKKKLSGRAYRFNTGTSEVLMSSSSDIGNIDSHMYLLKIALTRNCCMNKKLISIVIK